MLDLRIDTLAAATMDDHRAGPFGLVAQGAIGVKDGRIAYVGESRAAPPARAVRDCTTLIATPALIDCHTHLVFAGNRADEFAMRRAGRSYEEIARAGGGILSTVRATRAASAEAIAAEALPRLLALAASGAATVEIKSGYGLDVENEMKLLDTAREIGRRAGVRVSTTLLGAHALPPDYHDDRQGYVDLICSRMIPEAAARGLADAVDAFCETIAFTPRETERVFEAAAKAGLRVKLHAEQLSNQHGAALAARHRALSADHLEHLDTEGAFAIAAAGVVAVLLPAAFLTLNETQKPPVDLLRRAGAQIAIATDCNPGTSPALNAALMLPLAATLFGLSPEECLAGMTRCAARALGLEGETGMLKQGLSADIALWQIGDPSELAYWLGAPGPAALYVGGREHDVRRR